VGLLAAFAGVLIGFAGSTLAYRYRLLRVPGGGVLVRMDRDLGLTPAQHAQVREIMHDTRLKVMEQRRDFQRARHQVFQQALSQVRAILTTEQRAKFDRDFVPPRMRGIREEGGGPGAPGGPPQPAAPPPPEHPPTE
jgi:Spy/CpxP family protein refolding chaperone